MKSPGASTRHHVVTTAARLVRLHVLLLASLGLLLVLDLVIDAPPSVLLLDEQDDGEDGEAAEGEDDPQRDAAQGGDETTFFDDVNVSCSNKQANRQ